MGSPIQRLQEKVLSKKGSKVKRTYLTDIVDFIRELGCFGEIIGRDFEVRNPEGELVYTIRQKPIAMKQLNMFMKELWNLKKEDAEREAAKWGGKKGSPMKKPRKR